jgi:hypothetical protein
VKPQTGQVATLVIASTTRKLGQPFVLQKRRLVAVWLRRRILRIATDRPATELVVVRVIILVSVFPSGARVSRAHPCARRGIVAVIPLMDGSVSGAGADL